MDAAVHVIADDREARAGVIGELRRIPEVSVEVRRLETGDYLVDDAVRFERKRLADFAASLVDGRLFGQALRLSGACGRPVIILEGSSRDLAGCGVRREAMQGALICLGIVLGIAVLRAANAWETARLIAWTAGQISRNATGVPRRYGHRPRGRRRRQLFVLQGLPGVGPERSARLLDAFGSVQEVMMASAECLAQVQGIGPGIASRIRWLVG